MQKADFLVLLEEMIDAPRGTLTEATVLADQEGWDSMAIVGFIGLMDDEFQVAPEPKAITACLTVGDLVALAAGHVE
jgi:acyl carrier protein